MASTGERILELAEDRLRVAEELGLSAAGLVARIYACVDREDIEEASDHLEAIDLLINEARAKSLADRQAP